MKFENPEWRRQSPGELRDVWGFKNWAVEIAKQGRVHDILEDFRDRFSKGRARRSSTAYDAESDLWRLMDEAAKNAPLFIEAFVNGCIDAKAQGCKVPSVGEINQSLAWTGYSIEGDMLVAGSSSGRNTTPIESLADTPPPPSGRGLAGAHANAGRTAKPNAASQGSGTAGTSKPRPRLKVFLCHSSGDKEAVKDLYRDLRAYGYDPWLDVVNLIPGQDWEAEIKKAVRKSHAVVVCLSLGSVTKAGFVQKEIRFALNVADEQPEGRIFIIPARLDEVDVPDRLSKWHWVDLFEPDGFNKLLGSLVTRASEL